MVVTMVPVWFTRPSYSIPIGLAKLGSTRQAGDRSPSWEMDEARSQPLPSGPVIFFDGVCNLCNGAVRWIAKRDSWGRFRFASLQSEAARLALGEAGRPDSMVLVDREGVHFRSEAALRIARGLGPPWSLLCALVVVPRPIRDAVYDFVARNRYRWFGRQESCPLPAPELVDRFLD